MRDNGREQIVRDDENPPQESAHQRSQHDIERCDGMHEAEQETRENDASQGIDPGG